MRVLERRRRSREARPASRISARAIGAAGNLRVSLAPWLLGTVAVVTLGMALVSGLAALRILRQVEPANLLR